MEPLRFCCACLHLRNAHAREYNRDCIMMLKLLVSALFLVIFTARGSHYSIVNTTVGGMLKSKRIQNDDTGEYVEMIVDFGGRVEDLVLKSRSTGDKRKVLLTHNDNATAVLENKWWKGMLLLPWANRIAYGKYDFFNSSYQLPVNENTTNPLHQNALHGLMNGRRLRETGSEITNTYASLQLSYYFDKPVPGYPFIFEVSINYNLSDTGFEMHFSVRNRMETTPMPFYMGWHPYFACTAYKAFVMFDMCTSGWNHVELNANMDPTGTTKFYHGFNGTKPIGGTETNPTFYDDEFKPIQPNSPACGNIIETSLYDVTTKQTVVLWQDRSFRLVHVFTGSESLFDQDAVAIEPMSGMADAYNNHDHLSILSGGEEWNGAVGVYVQ